MFITTTRRKPELFCVALLNKWLTIGNKAASHKRTEQRQKTKTTNKHTAHTLFVDTLFYTAQDYVFHYVNNDPLGKKYHCAAVLTQRMYEGAIRPIDVPR